MPTLENSFERREWTRRFCVAPMMDVTDRHMRYLLRLISSRAHLYTEMITTGAMLHGDRERFLGFHPAEHPVALQLGGSDPDALSRCARLAKSAGFDEINLNVGCPSERVQSGRFGACLMAEPETVADCVAAMRDAAALPVTVKTRIGIDQQDSFDALLGFVDKVSAAGCRTFIIHARKAWLKGLSPKQNREVPPLRYEVVRRLKLERPSLEIIINGGIHTLEQAADHLGHVDGVMLGRAAFHDPYLLAGADARLFGDPARPRTRAEVVADYLPYVESQLADGVPLARLSRCLVGLFLGQPGARAWRRHLSEGAHRHGAGTGLIEAALAEVTNRAAPATHAA